MLNIVPISQLSRKYHWTNRRGQRLLSWRWPLTYHTAVGVILGYSSGGLKGLSNTGHCGTKVDTESILSQSHRRPYSITPNIQISRIIKKKKKKGSQQTQLHNKSNFLSQCIGGITFLLSLSSVKATLPLFCKIHSPQSWQWWCWLCVYLRGTLLITLQIWPLFLPLWAKTALPSGLEAVTWS